jgi:osmotically-inducible protein OsmY
MIYSGLGSEALGKTVCAGAARQWAADWEADFVRSSAKGGCGQARERFCWEYNMTDEQLQREIERVLREDHRVDEREVTVAVAGSQVTLTGAVDSVAEKRAARQDVESVPGVEGVTDRMTVKNFVKVPDEELVAVVRNALSRDAYVDDSRIEVYASNGEVRLDGTVATYQERKAAADVVWWTPGVINVENLLLVTEEDFVDVDPQEAI